MLFNCYPYNVLIFQLEATNRRLRELEEQVGLEMQAKDEMEHNYRLDNQCFILHL